MNSGCAKILNSNKTKEAINASTSTERDEKSKRAEFDAKTSQISGDKYDLEKVTKMVKDNQGNPCEISSEGVREESRNFKNLWLRTHMHGLCKNVARKIYMCIHPRRERRQ
jgi:hypothetical protein